MYFPVMIQMCGKNVVVFGGGKIAFRKCQSILTCKGNVIVISKEFVEGFHLLKKKYQKCVTLIEAEYKEAYLDHCYLVIAATNCKDTNQLIVENCGTRNLLCNVVDNGDISDYIVPSVVRRGDLIISISTSGKSPSLSIKIKKEIEELYTDDLEQYVNLLGVMREKILSEDKSDVEKKKLLNGLVHKSVEELRLMNN